MESAEFTAVMAAVAALLTTTKRLTGSDAEPFIADLQASTRLLQEQELHDAAELLGDWVSEIAPALLMADAMNRSAPN